MARGARVLLTGAVVAVTLSGCTTGISSPTTLTSRPGWIDRTTLESSPTTTPTTPPPPTTTTISIPGRVATSGDLQHTPADQGLIAAQVAEAHMAGWMSEDPQKWEASKSLTMGARLDIARNLESTKMRDGIYTRGSWKIVTYTPAIKPEPLSVRLYACVRTSLHTVDTKNNQNLESPDERIMRVVVYVDFVHEGTVGGGAWKVLSVLEPKPEDKFTCS